MRDYSHKRVCVWEARFGAMVKSCLFLLRALVCCVSRRGTKLSVFGVSHSLLSATDVLPFCPLHVTREEGSVAE